MSSGLSNVLHIAMYLEQCCRLIVRTGRVSAGQVMSPYRTSLPPGPMSSDVSKSASSSINTDFDDDGGR